MPTFRPPPIFLLVGLLTACGVESPERDADRAPIVKPIKEQSPAPQPEFDARRQRALPGKPEWVSAGDIDGDGFDELLATTLSPGTLHVFSGSAAGIAQEPISLQVGDYPLRPLLVPDTNGTGQHVIVAERATGSLAWLRPLHSPGEQVLARVTLDSPPRALAAGDMGHDGQTDLILALDGPQLVVMDERGTRQVLALAADSPRCIALAGDCLFVGSQAERRVDRYLWRDGKVSPEPASFDLPGIPRALSLDDVDADGDLELLIAGGEDSLWVLGWQNPGGPLALDPALSASRLLTWDQHFVPIDLCLRRPGLGPPTSAGPFERLVLNYASMTYSRLWKLSRSGPRGTQRGYAGQTPTAATFIHLNSDPFLDLVIANRDSNAISLITGKDQHTFQQPERVPVGGFPNAMAQGDLNGDGRTDLVVVNSKQDSISILIGKEGGLVRFGESHVDRGPHRPRILDLDGDGHLDCALLTSDATGCRFRRFFGDGSGALTADPAAEAQRVGTGNGDWIMCDLTGDGDQELLTLSPELDQLVIFAAPGRKPLRYLQTQPFPGGPKALVALQGEPGLGPAIAIAITRGEQKGILIGSFDRSVPSGALPWNPSRAISLPMVPIALKAADMDGNGLEDLVLLGLTSEAGTEGLLAPVLQYEVDGVRHFRGWMHLATSTMPRDLDLADLNGDGLPEVLVCAQFAHVVDLWEGVATSRGGFSLIRRDGIGTGVGSMAAEVMDLDGKGGPDLAVADGHADQVSLVMNATDLAP
ncbi:MAG: VCBS repeat-containing protein [Planctomycetota bacterium]|nr:VCBS repeat-containing protein [Planctomycetota bacterium]